MGWDRLASPGRILSSNFRIESRCFFHMIEHCCLNNAASLWILTGSWALMTGNFLPEWNSAKWILTVSRNPQSPMCFHRLDCCVMKRKSALEGEFTLAWKWYWQQQQKGDWGGMSQINSVQFRDRKRWLLWFYRSVGRIR